jgi:hypothetical protein
VHDSPRLGPFGFAGAVEDDEDAGGDEEEALAAEEAERYRG